MIAGLRLLGAFTVGEGIVASDGREPDADVAFQAKAGTWHAYLRDDASLMAIHAAHEARAGDPPLSYGGDRAQALASALRAAGATPSADWKALRLSPEGAKLVEETAQAEPAFVARWGVGPIRVGIWDEAALDEGAEISDDAAGVAAHGCWAQTANDDGWAVYAVFDGDDAVMVRVRLSANAEHAAL